MFRAYTKSFSILKSAVKEADEANEFYNYAEPEMIDEAIYELKAKELRLDRIIREIRRKSGLKTLDRETSEKIRERWLKSIEC